MRPFAVRHNGALFCGRIRKATEVAEALETFDGAEENVYLVLLLRVWID